MLQNITRITFILLGLLAFGISPAGAATITVGVFVDDLTVNGNCTLREAIQSVNTGGNIDGCVNTGAAYGTADTITLPAGTYTNAITGSDDANAMGDLDITKSVIINGPAFTPPALPTTIIDGGGATIGRVFQLVTTGITVSINNVIIQNGTPLGGGDGGGIFSAATLTVTNSIIRNNTGGKGGGINCSSGSVTVDNSTISGNVSNSGGGVFSRFSACTGLTVQNNSLIDGNSADASLWGGGGILTFVPPVTITDSTISNNTSGLNGGGIEIVDTGTVTITSSTIDGNSSSVQGGGIHNTAGTVAIHSSTISNNTAASGAGGIESSFSAVSLTIDDSIGTGSTISGNTTSVNGGGGILVFGGSTTISDTTISGNTTTTGNGGGIATSGITALTITNTAISGNMATTGQGGGIFNTGSAASVSNTTISGNTAKTSGGGIRHLFSSSAKLLTLVNSTISGNTVTAGSGGGIDTNDTLTVTNTTITNNSATTTGGGIQIGGLAVNLKNTIVANQAAGGDCSTTVTSSLNDLDSDNSCGVGTTAANALLGPLAANGGPIPTQTHTLLTGSPALDAGDPTTCTNAPVNNLDQRGLPRPQGTTCDIGAVEANHQPQPTAPDITNTGVAANSQVTHHDPDTANPGNNWTYSVLTVPTHGGATVSGTGLATYTPNPGWLGNDSFVIKVLDDGILPLSGTVTVNVIGTTPPATPPPPAATTGADLSIHKLASANPVVGGGLLIYTLNIQNRGPLAASNVVVNDSLPAGMDLLATFISQGTCSGTVNVLCHLGTLANGATATVLLAVTPKTTVTIPGLWINFASVGSATHDPKSNNNRSAVATNVIAGASASVSLTLNATAFKTGDPLTLAGIMNPGASSVMADIYFGLQLPDGTTFFKQPDGSFSTTVAPAFTNSLLAAVSGTLFSYTFLGSEPPGIYEWFLILFNPGTANLIGQISTAPFTFTP